MLLNKLKSLGIGGRIGRWIYSFLTDRFQRVSVNGTLSSLFEVLSGVPQGSVLGPLLFLFVISDIDVDVNHSSLRSFADDSRLVARIHSLAEMCLLQDDLGAVYSWVVNNKMLFNDTKFEMMRCSLFDVSLPSPEYQTLSGGVINKKQEVKDLGITLSSNCSFSLHISDVVDKMKQKSS